MAGPVSSVPPDEPLVSRPPTVGKVASQFKLAGEEAVGRALMSREFARFQGEVQADAKKPAPPKQGKVFTLWLYPPPGSTDQPLSALTPMHLPWGDRDLLFEMVRVEAESLYARGGSELVERLRPSAEASIDNYVQGLDREFIWKLPNAVPWKPEDERLIRRAGALVVDACQTAVEQVMKRAAAARKRIEPVAATLAVGRMARARAEIEKEQARYFTARSVPWLPETVRFINLEGRDARDLADALRDVHQVRARLQNAASKLDELVQKSRSGNVRALPPRWVDEARALREHPDVAAALRSATEDLALAVSVYGRHLPVLFRVWNMPDLPSGDGALEQIDSRVGTALRKAWAANADLVTAIERNPSMVWKYPPAVQAALDQLGYTCPSVEYQAAQEEVARVQGTMSFLTKLGMVVGALDVLIGLAGAVPWVGAVIAVTTLVVGAASLLEEYLEEAKNEAAYKAVLDPSRALAAEPDYSGLLLGVVFTLLDVKGVRDALGAAKFAADAKFAEAAVRAVSR